MQDILTILIKDGHGKFKHSDQGFSKGLNFNCPHCIENSTVGIIESFKQFKGTFGESTYYICTCRTCNTKYKTTMSGTIITVETK
jgi:hypothetical protein